MAKRSFGINMHIHVCIYINEHNYVTSHAIKIFIMPKNLRSELAKILISAKIVKVDGRRNDFARS